MDNEIYIKEFGQSKESILSKINAMAYKMMTTVVPFKLVGGAEPIFSREMMDIYYDYCGHVDLIKPDDLPEIKSSVETVLDLFSVLYTTTYVETGNIEDSKHWLTFLDLFEINIIMYFKLELNFKGLNFNDSLNARDEILNELISEFLLERDFVFYIDLLEERI